MDVPGKMVRAAQQLQRFDNLFGGIVRAALHAAAQKQALNVVAPVKAHRQIGKLGGGKGRAGRFVTVPVDTVLAVKHADIRHQHFQQRHAAPVRRPGVADTAVCGAAKACPCGGGIPRAGRSTGDIVLCRVGQNCQFFKHIHLVAPFNKKPAAKTYTVLAAGQHLPA
ncbi:hypothetical protein SDC9_175122 [bioreactor metagenome]|uniref:Uncharacterized protein n=1 Tax=bioreactor metagenome TaxID=1076179 RepID=A0A645GL94_9ZZZZ